MATRAIRLRIESSSYRSVVDHPLYITPELKARLEAKKRRDGTFAYGQLVSRGFRGGKHLIETVRAARGADCKILLSHDSSSFGKAGVAIDYDEFLAYGQARFFDVYRQTGLHTAGGFLHEAFPRVFPAPEPAPERRDVKRVLSALPEATEKLTKKDRAQIPQQIAELIDKQGAEFVFQLLSTVDAAIPRGQERIRVAFQDVIGRLAQEPVKALNELADLMGQWNLMQVTSLLNVLRSRLQAIETFEELILDEKTYELREDSSVHRTLERSMWLLNDEYWIAQSNRGLRKLVREALAKEDAVHAKRRPDFACVDALGRTVIVEIKKPSLELKKEEIDQAELYFRIVKKHFGSGVRAKPAIYLVGGKISTEASEIAEMRGYPSLMTYQELIVSCRRRYQEYLRVVEGEDLPDSA